MDKKIMQKGLSIVEVLMSLSIVATAVALICTVSITSSAAIKQSDVTSFFDNKNLNATATFKTNPDINYLKTQIPFDEMEFDDATMTFSQKFDGNLKKLGAGVPESDPRVQYKTEYKISITDSQEGGFRFENKEIKLDLFNYSKDEETLSFNLLSNSASKGSVTIHTNYLNESSVVPPPSNPDPSNPDPSNPDPSNPDPTDPDDGEEDYHYLTFRLSGGRFAETGNDVLVKMVPAGKKYGDKLEVDTDSWKAILPEEGIDFTKKTGYTSGFSGWQYADGSGVVSPNHIIDSDISIIGSYSQIVNDVIGMEATVTGRDFWDITSSSVEFYEQEGSLYLKVTEEPTTAGTPPHDAGSYSVNLGLVSGYRDQIKNPDDIQSINLTLNYNYVDTKAFMERHPELILAYDGTAVSSSIAALYDGTGARFTLAENTLNNLGAILGMQSGTVNINFIPVSNAVDRTVKESKVSRNYSAILILGGVNGANRIDNELYQIKFVKNPNKDSQGRVTYQFQLIGENGDNIMHPDYEAGREWGKTIYMTKNFYFGGEIDTIDTFSLLEWASGPGDFVPLFADPVTAEGSDIQVNRVLFARHNNPYHRVSATKPAGNGSGGYLQMYGSLYAGNVYHFNWVKSKNNHSTSVGTWTSAVQIETGIELPLGFSTISE